MQKTRTHTETRPFQLANRPAKLGLFTFMGVGGRLGAGWGQTQRPAPKTRSVAAVHSHRERRRSDTEGPRPKFPHNEKQARAIPASEVQPHHANDETRTEPPGAVQPRHRHRSGRASRDDSKKNLCVTRCEAGIFSSPTTGARDRAGHNAAEKLGAILDGGRRKRPDRTGGTGTGAALSLGAWNPKARGLKIRRLNGEKRTRGLISDNIKRDIFQHRM